jgi:FAD/FMN-containing dehydrogenase
MRLVSGHVDRHRPMHAGTTTMNSADRPGDTFGGIYRQDLEARAVYSEAAGIGRVLPWAIAVPRDAADVVALVQWANATSSPLIPRASGSSMPGGAIGTGTIVDLSRMNAVGAPDPTDRRIVIGPGAIRNRVDQAARRIGLRFPVDPSSGAFCSIGGMVSTNAAGARTLKYGAMRRWVHALDCVFADGSRGIVRRGDSPPASLPVDRFLADVAPRIRESVLELELSLLRKNSSGYGLVDFARTGDLVDMLVGSEGTLAIVVGIELDLARVPGATASLLASFSSLETAVIATEAARGASASACELLDRTFLDVAARGGPLPIPAETEAVLLIELEGDDAEAASEAARTLAADLDRVGATSVAIGLNADDEHRLWELRHAASPILSRLDPSLKSMQFIEDGVVPPERLADYVAGVRAALSAHDTPGVIFGHAGDAHVHVNPLIDVQRDGWRERLARILSDVVDLTARLGGSLAGEHGDGSLRAPLLDRTTPARVLELARRVKDAFDPNGLLNPGVKVPLPGQLPVVHIKYDPTLPPLPSAAARVLQRVEREWAYADFRLDMLERESETG